MAKAKLHDGRVLLLFINNPPVHNGYPDSTGMGPSYDVLTAPTGENSNSRSGPTPCRSMMEM
jgi:hypothetical protein